MLENGGNLANWRIICWESKKKKLHAIHRSSCKTSTPPVPEGLAMSMDTAMWPHSPGGMVGVAPANVSKIHTLFVMTKALSSFGWATVKRAAPGEGGRNGTVSPGKESGPAVPRGKRNGTKGAQHEKELICTCPILNSLTVDSSE